MLVDDPACGGFERRSKSRGGFRDVFIDERMKRRGLISDDERRRHKENLRLALVEIAHEVYGDVEIPSLLADRSGRRVLPRRGEVTAARGALDLSKTLRAAAHGAVSYPERRARAAGTPIATQSARHGTSL